MPAEPEPLLETLLQRLEEAWEHGGRVLVETLVQNTSDGTLSEDEFLELVYAEVDARTNRGEQPQLAEYERRFPAHAERLRRLFEIHLAVETGISKEIEPPPQLSAAKPVNEIHFDLVNPPPLPPLKPPSHQQETFLTDVPSPLGPRVQKPQDDA